MKQTNEHPIDGWSRDSLKKFLSEGVRSMFDRRYKATDRESNYEKLMLLSGDLYNLANDIRVDPNELEGCY